MDSWDTALVRAEAQRALNFQERDALFVRALMKRADKLQEVTQSKYMSSGAKVQAEYEEHAIRLLAVQLESPEGRAAFFAGVE